MKILIATFKHLAPAQQAMLDLSAEGYEHRHIHTGSAPPAPAARVTVVVDEADVPRAAELLEFHDPIKVIERDAGPPGSVPIPEMRQSGILGEALPTARVHTLPAPAGTQRTRAPRSPGC